MSAASTETSAPLPTAGSRVFFQPPSGVGCVGSGPITAADDPVQKRQGKVTVKYDRKELRKRLVLEEWIIEQLSELYDCEVSGARAHLSAPPPSPTFPSPLPRQDAPSKGQNEAGRNVSFLGVTPSSSFPRHPSFSIICSSNPPPPDALGLGWNCELRTFRRFIPDSLPPLWKVMSLCPLQHEPTLSAAAAADIMTAKIRVF